MDSITELIQRNFEEYGRLHWRLENTETRTVTLLSVLEEFRQAHPVETLENGEWLVAYVHREDGWAIEPIGWRDTKTGLMHQVTRLQPIIIARVTTKKPAAKGNVELRLRSTGQETMMLFVGLLTYLQERLPGATLRNMLVQKQTKPSPSKVDPWANSAIRETFAVPVDKSILARVMEFEGLNAAQRGPLLFTRRTLPHRSLDPAPEVKHFQDGIQLTWYYADAYSMESVSSERRHAMQWRLRDTTDGVMVEAYCRLELFRKYYYQLKSRALWLPQQVVNRQSTDIGSRASEATVVGGETATPEKNTLPAATKLPPAGQQSPTENNPVMLVTDKRTHIADEPAPAQRTQDAIDERVSENANTSELGSGPPRPGIEGATWADVFRWYDKCPHQDIGTLRELAAALGYEPRTVYNQHAKYNPPYGKKPRNTR